MMKDNTATTTLVPLTARELMDLHCLTVEEGLRRGFCIEGHVKEYREAHSKTLRQERHGLAYPGYSHRAEYSRSTRIEKIVGVIESKPMTPAEMKNKTDREELYTVDKSTRIELLMHLMSSESFLALSEEQTALLLTKLLYGEKDQEKSAPKPEKKHAGGRQKKAAVTEDVTEEAAE